MTTCDYCGGSGVVRGTTTIHCTACDGSGQILSGTTCPACRGLAFQVVETDVLCLECDGSGFSAPVESLES